MRRTQTLLVGLLTASVLLPPAIAARSQDRCRDVLKFGVLKLHSLTSEDLSGTFRDALCLTKHGRIDQERAFELGVPIPLAGKILDLSLGADERRMTELRSKYCREVASDLEATEYRYLLFKTAPPEVVAAWLECMKGEERLAPGFDHELSLRSGGSRADISLYYKSGPAQEKVTVGEFVTVNAQCTRDLTNQEITEYCCKTTCERDPDLPSIILVSAAEIPADYAIQIPGRSRFGQGRFGKSVWQ